MINSDLLMRVGVIFFFFYDFLLICILNIGFILKYIEKIKLVVLYVFLNFNVNNFLIKIWFYDKVFYIY